MTTDRMPVPIMRRVNNVLSRFVRHAFVGYACRMTNRHLLVWDIVSQPLVIIAAFSLRLDVLYPARFQTQMHVYGLLSALVVPIAFHKLGIYRRFWTYASADEAALIALGAMIGSLATAAVVFLVLLPLGLLRSVPRTIPLLAVLLTTGTAAFPRYAIRVANRYRSLNEKPTSEQLARRVLIAGAGDAGHLVLRELLANPQLGYEPVGLVDDDPSKHGLEILGCSVLGATEDIPRLVRGYTIETLFIAIPSASGQIIGQIARKAQEAGAQVLTLPGYYELLAGEVSVERLRPIQVEDLLRRAPVQTDAESIAHLIRNRRVMVTGGGGSIGSELCRQTARCRPSALIILGHGENSVYQISSELRRQYPQMHIERVVADIRDTPRLQQVFAAHRPHIVLHAAAHKHVPLMEANMPDAVSNNILGTRNVVEQAIVYNVGHMVMISSDKAVNPSSVMGVTKRVAEMIVQDAARSTGRAFTAVRFGNVLGSRGSVVPLFQQQIATGGPVTVTHPEVRRYFMTIPEAVQLVLQAANLGRGGEIFVLDMGEPLRIVDLARDMISLSGLKEGQDIEIAYVGMRPGEKLFEELSVHDEHHVPSPHASIFVLRQNEAASDQCSAMLHPMLDALIGAAQAGDCSEIQRLLHALVPEYVEAANGDDPDRPVLAAPGD